MKEKSHRGDSRACRERVRTSAAAKSEDNPRPSSSQDQGDVDEALRRLKDPADREIPYAEARKRLGLG